MNNPVQDIRNEIAHKKQSMQAQPKEHNQILAELKNELTIIDFRTEAGLEEKEKLQRKHQLVITIEKLLNKAKEKKFGLAKRHDFIYIYNGAYWKLVDADDFKMFLGDSAEKMGVCKFDSKHYVFKDHLYKQFISDAHLQAPEKDNATTLINLLNGTFEITSNSQQLRNFKRSDFITYQLPFNYDPEAKAPKFENYLNDVLPGIEGKELQKILSEFIGYIFVKNLKLEKCLLLYGFGANGKSVFFDIVNALLGRENVSNFSLQNLSEEHNRALIVNKLLNYGSEIRGNIESDIFKQLISGEPTQARLKYGNSFIAEDYAKLCFNCNTLPKDVEHTEAFFRRFIIIPFKQTIKENKRDPELAKKIIKNELSGVFNWVIEGLKRVIQNKGFTASNTVRKQIEDYKKDSDSTLSYFEEMSYVKSFHDSETMPLKDLYPGYRSYCIGNGLNPLGSKNFGARLRANDFHLKKLNTGTVVYIKHQENTI